jgi:serine/threonine-protein kinase
VDPERYRRVKELVHGAADLGEAERAAFLDGVEPELRREVERFLETTGVPTGDIVPVVPPEPPLVLGPWRLEREIGRGGMGTVYEAVDTRSSTRVAVKILHPYLPRERFEREARLGREVSHPNVVRTLEFATVGEHALIAMEFAEGRTLRGPLDEARLRDVARQVAEGLAAIHAKGIVHRDLKPENLLVTEGGAVRIMDLGIAKPGDASVALTLTGQFLGSLPYASPEQCAGGETGPMADLYALGVVLYELAAGANPFRASTPGRSLMAQLEIVPPPLAGVSPFLSAVVATLLEKDPARRFPSARALATALAKGEKSAWWLARGLKPT